MPFRPRGRRTRQRQIRHRYRSLRLELLSARVVMNAAPIAKDDRVELVQNKVASIDYLLLNDEDEDGDALSVVAHSTPGHGTLTEGADGKLTYSPTSGYVGPDSFTYTVSDGNGGQTDAQVSIMVNAPLDAAAARTQILASVSTLADPDGPGHMVVYGPTAISVANYSGKDLSEPMIAAATLGKGRVIALPDAQWLDMDRLGTDTSTATFYTNSMAWLAGSTAKDTAIVTFEDQASMNWLKSRGFTNVKNSQTATLATDLVGAKVLMAGWIGSDPSDATLNAMRDFVTAGGGLFVAEYGIGYDWWWNKSVEDIPVNRLLKQAGIGFTKAWPVSGAQTVKAADHTMTADEIEAIFLDPSKVANAKLLEALNVYSVISTVLTEDDSVRLRLDRAFQPLIAGVNPTPATPVTDDLSKAILTAEMSAASTLPPQKVKPHRTAAAVYGEVPDDAPRIASRSVKVDGDKTGWRATGMYAAPGELITIEVPNSLVNKGYSIRINGNVDNISSRDSWERVPFGVSRSFEINSSTIEIANAFGGQIYIDFGGGSMGTPPQLGELTVTIQNAIEAPLFRLGIDTDADWMSTLRDRPAPYAEFASDHLAFSVPSAWIRELSNPEELMTFWNDAVAFMDYVGAITDLRSGPERINYDVQISVGLLHSGYPMQGPVSYGSRIVDVEMLMADGDWGWFHELGHEHQRNSILQWGYENPWTFPGGVEVTVNIFANAALEQMTTANPAAGGWNYSVSSSLVMDLAATEITSTTNPTFDSKSLYPFYFQFADGPWGWQGYHDVMATYVNDQLNAPDKLPKTTQEKKDQWLIRWSRVTGYDMTSYMVGQWKMEASQSALAAVAALNLPKWMPLAMTFDSLKVPLGGSRSFDLASAGLELSGKAKFISVSQPSQGTLTVSNNAYTYKPTAQFATSDEFEVTYESTVGNRQTFKIPVQIFDPQGLLIERYDNITGTTVKSLTDNAAFPNLPSSVDYLTSFKAPSNAGDNYGVRVSGYVSVPTSGQYTFYIASDDESELRLSSTESPQEATKIASLKGWSNPETYTTNASQTSSPIFLEVGKFYYIEALMKEGGGGDHLSVAWTGPDTNTPTTIPSDYLFPSGVDLAAVKTLKPVVTLAVDKTSIGEAAGEAIVTATLSRVSDQAVTIDLTVSGSATPLVDHKLNSSAQIVIPPGERKGTLKLTASRDSVSEPNEDVLIGIRTVTGGVLSAPQSIAVTIVDDDALPKVTLSSNKSSISEAAGSAVITATLSAVSELPVTVELGFSGTAASPGDYSRSATQIAIPAGRTSGSITMIAVQDSVDETDESIVVDMVAATNANEATEQQVSLVMTDDDSAPIVTLSRDRATIAEAGGNAIFTATLSAPSALPVTIALGLSGAATAGTDYSTSAMQIVIPAGSTSGAMTLTAMQDSLDETDESIVVEVVSALNGTLALPQRTSITLTDDDQPATVTLSVDRTSLAEASGAAVVTATLSSASGLPVTIAIGFAGAATIDSDYTSSATQIVIPAGETSGSVTITTLQDTLNEESETVIANLGEVINGNAAAAQSRTLTIADDDPEPSVTLSSEAIKINEAAGSTKLIATLSAASGLPVTVELSFSGAAESGLDYDRSDSKIVIPAGQTTGSIIVTAIQDILDEPDEQVVADVVAVTGGVEATLQRALVTIADDDEPIDDYGDAPSSYPVKLANDGARHRVGSLYLGTMVDAEPDGKPSSAASGDGDDDDGITLLTTLISSSEVTTSSLLATASGSGKLDAWIDFNRDGDWLDEGEQILISANVTAGVNLLSFQVPEKLISGSTGVRFRLSSIGGLNPTGAAADGEVEDYLVSIVAGATTVNLNMTLPAGGGSITTEANQLVAKQNDIALFRVPLASFGSLNVEGSAADDPIEFKLGSDFGSKKLTVDGGGGHDRLQWNEAARTIDMTSANVVLKRIAEMDFSGTGNNTLVISVPAVKSATVAEDSFMLIYNRGDSVSFGTGWKVEQPHFVDGKLYHFVVEDSATGTAKVQILNDRPLTNPLQPADADRDGKVLPLDALRVINELGRRGAGPVKAPTNDTQIGRLYFDVSGDLQLTALDALRVINAFARLNRNGSGEGEDLGGSALPQPVDLNSINDRSDVNTNAETPRPIESKIDQAMKMSRVPSLDMSAAMTDGQHVDLAMTELTFDSEKDSSENLLATVEDDMLEQKV